MTFAEICTYAIESSYFFGIQFEGIKRKDSGFIHFGVLKLNNREEMVGENEIQTIYWHRYLRTLMLMSCLEYKHFLFYK